MKGRSTPFGPMAPDGRLTREGQAFVEEWLARWPRPGRLLRTYYGSLWDFAVAHFGSESVNAVCESAAAMAARTFVARADKPTGFLSYWISAMRNEIKELLYASRLCNWDTRALPLRDPRRPGCLALANNVPESRRRVVGVSIDDFESALRWVPNARDRAILRRCLLDGDSSATVGREFGLCGQRVRDIQLRAIPILQRRLKELL